MYICIIGYIYISSIRMHIRQREREREREREKLPPWSNEVYCANEHTHFPFMGSNSSLWPTGLHRFLRLGPNYPPSWSDNWSENIERVRDHQSPAGGDQECRVCFGLTSHSAPRYQTPPPLRPWDRSSQRTSPGRGQRDQPLQRWPCRVRLLRPHLNASAALSSWPLLT